jgi:hypothetical protein
MSTNLKLLSALSLAGLLVGGAAHAAGLVAAGNAFHISGSTALDNQIKDALLLPSSAGGPCTAGTISVYTDAPSTAPAGNLTKSHQATVVCTLATSLTSSAPGAVTVPSGTVVAFTKESNGGSNEGTFYPASQASLAFFDATQTPVGCGSAISITAGAYWTHQQAFTEYDACSGVVIQAIPEVGVADEDPSVFVTGLNVVTPALIAALNTTPLFQNQFGVGVSLNLYRALQAQQGLTVGDDSLAQMPTLTKSQIASLFGGTISNWNQIVSSTGTALALPAGGGTVYTCRRGDNSGTNVSADIYFLHNRCTSVNPPMVQATTANNSTACNGLSTGQTPENNGCHWQNSNLSDATFAGAAGGDVASCLDAHSRGGTGGAASATYAYGPLGTTSKFDDPNGATGANAETGSNHWRYIAIDGHKPTVEGMANGTYDYAFDNVENLWTGLTGKSLSVGQFLSTLFQSPVALADILVAQPNAKTSGGVVDTNYVTGGLLDPLPLILAGTGGPNNPPVSTTTLGTNPVGSLTYYALGSVNNCQVPVVSGGNSISKEVF